MYFELNGWKSNKSDYSACFLQSLKSTASTYTHTHTIHSAHIFHFANPSVENMWEAHFNCRVIRSYTNTIEAVGIQHDRCGDKEWSQAIMKSHFRPKLSYIHTHTLTVVYFIYCVCVRACLFVYVNKKKGKKVRFIYTYMFYSFSVDAIVIYNKQHITRLVFISDRIERENLLFVRTVYRTEDSIYNCQYQLLWMLRQRERERYSSI